MMRKWTLLIATSAAFLYLGPLSLVVGVAQENGSEKSRAASPEVSEELQPRSPSKLYEAISGYLEGFRGKHQETSGKESERTKFDPSLIKPTDGSPINYRQRFEAERAHAESLMQRGDWSLAALSIERALEAASHLEPAPDPTNLRRMLQDARLRADNSRTNEASNAGEIRGPAGIKLVMIPQGAFLMGSDSAEIRRLENNYQVERDAFEPEQPAHTVEITKPFLLGKYEVTIGQFRQFVNETGYTTVAEKQGWGWVYDEKQKHWVKKSGASWKYPGTKVWDDHPVTLVCHQDANAFCTWLSSKDNRRYHLPTEAQWEYAARGGKEGDTFPWGEDYPDGRKLNLADRRSPVPWADRTIDDEHAGLAPVGSFEPNDFLLYDMVGNVWELCSDNYSSKAYEKLESKISVDPEGPARGKKKVVRGGNWAFGAGIARNAFRFAISPDLCVDVNGFRVAAVARRDDETVKRTSKQDTSTDRSSRPGVSEILAQVKTLVERGRREEARELVKQFVASLSTKEGPYTQEPADLITGVLEAMIDITRDRSQQSFTNSLGMKMVRIPAGSFVMGSSEMDIGWAMGTLAREQPVSLENEYPFHKVRISRPFFISATEVTVGQFRAFVEETGYITDAEDAGGGQVFDTEENSFEVKEGSSWKNPGWEIEDSQPVTMASYNDAQAFCDWLSAKEKLPYKLPTEAQWEYAARGGLPMAQFPWGDDLPDGRKANYADKNTSFEWRDRYADDGYKFVAPVGSYKANGFGLYDMAGNVLEWVRDYYGEDYYRFTPEVDPEGPGHGENRVMKGGEWTFGAVNLRCAFRGWSRAELAFYNSGFRVAIDLASPRRIFHFADDFLTKEWVPRPDQREVASAMAKEKERQTRLRASLNRKTAKTPAKLSGPPPTIGVRILGFTPKSDARKAGLAKGDVIVEYFGTRDLTSEKLIALTATTKQKRVKPTLVFIRDGFEYSVTVAPGFLGVTVANTRIRGPFKKPERRPQRSRDRDRDRKKRSKKLDWT